MVVITKICPLYSYCYSLLSWTGKKRK